MRENIKIGTKKRNAKAIECFKDELMILGAQKLVRVKISKFKGTHENVKISPR